MPKLNRPRRIMVPVYLDPDQREALKKLSEKTRVPQAEYVREGVDHVLSKYRHELRTKR